MNGVFSFWIYACLSSAPLSCSSQPIWISPPIYAFHLEEEKIPQFLKAARRHESVIYKLYVRRSDLPV